MGSLTISNKTLDKYFGYLKYLDDRAKKNLIKKLTKSLKNTSKKETDLKSMFGAWEGENDSDEIILEIRNSRVHKVHTEGFE